MGVSEQPKRIRTREQAIEAGLQNCREMGWQLTDEQAARNAALLRPYMPLLFPDLAA